MTPLLEAILLVGGQGTRLRPLTLSTPKPMLPTAGVPFVAHQLARLREAGVARVVLATSYHAQTFHDHFGDGSGYGVDLVCVQEEEPLGTGGGVRNAAGWLRGGAGDPVLVLNGDVLSGHDITAQLDLHCTSQAAVTLHLTEVPDARRFGCVPTDRDGRVTAFHEKSPQPVTNRVNAGCYVFDRAAIDHIRAGEKVSVEVETFPALLEAGAVLMGYIESSYWLDVGTPGAYVRGSRDLVIGRLSTAALPGRPADSLVLDAATVAPDAVVHGGTSAGRGAVIGPGADVDGSILFDGVVIEDGAVVRDSVVASGARVGAGTVLDEVVAGEGADIGPGNELRSGVRIWPGTALPAGAIRFSSDV